MAKSRDHHIPQFLLRHFQSADEKLYVYDKSTDKIFNPNTENVFAPKDFYTVRIDENFITEDTGNDIKNILQKHSASISYEQSPIGKFESKSAPIISKIINGNAIALSIEERVYLSIFIEHLYKRNLPMRDTMAGAKQRMLEIVDDMKSHNTRLKESEDIKKLRSEEYTKLQHCIFLTQPIEKIVARIASMHWFLFKTSPNSEFLISDNPITIYADFRAAGFLSEGIYITFPISKEFCILLVCPTLLQEIISGGHEYILDERLLEFIEYGSKDEKCSLLINGLKKGYCIKSKNLTQVVNRAQVELFQRNIASSNEAYLIEQLSLYKNFLK